MYFLVDSQDSRLLWPVSKQLKFQQSMCQYYNNLAEPEYALDIKEVDLFACTGPGNRCNCS